MTELGPAAWNKWRRLAVVAAPVLRDIGATSIL